MSRKLAVIALAAAAGSYSCSVHAGNPETVAIVQVQGPLGAVGAAVHLTYTRVGSMECVVAQNTMPNSDFKIWCK